MVDHDYTDELLRRAEGGDKEAIDALKFLAKYNNETYKAVVRRDGSDFYRTEEERLGYYNSQYARKHDAVTYGYVDITEINVVVGEDEVIALIDFKRELEKSSKQ